MARSSAPSLSIVHHFANLTDPRLRRRRQHHLLDIIVIAICGVVCGCKSWEEIALYGRKKADWLETFLELPKGIPSKDTFLRGSHDRGPGKAALHLVSAWATANHFTLGQVAVDGKSNEITAIPQLLDLLDLSGAIVTIDAMGCQKGIARQIREGGGHYVLAVKSNQERLLEDIQACFAAELDKADGEGNYSSHESVEQGHGRRESRHYLTIERPSGIRDEALWADLRTISMVVSERRVAGGAATSEVRYYIGSKPGKAKEYARYIRGHWGIENSLHWVLDMAFDEDRSRTRKDHGPENVALLRRLAVSILKNAKACHGSIRSKQLQAMLDDAALEEMLRTFQAN